MQATDTSNLFVMPQIQSIRSILPLPMRKHHLSITGASFRAGQPFSFQDP
jgi:hypothetical protein